VGIRGPENLYAYVGNDPTDLEECYANCGASSSSSL
jgi:hypothetical protein